MFNYELTTTAACGCGAKQQTPYHNLYFITANFQFNHKKMSYYYWIMISTIDCPMFAQISNTADWETMPHTKKVHMTFIEFFTEVL